MTPDAQRNQAADSSSSDVQPTQLKKRTRRLVRRCLFSLVAILVVILVLAIGAPAILSTSVARQLVLEQINRSSINGTLNIRDWSIGWRRGIQLNDVQLTDENNEHLISVARIDLPMSLLKAARGKFDWAESTVTGADFNAVIDPSGNLNILQTIRPDKGLSHDLGHVRKVAGAIRFSQITGTLQDDPRRINISLAMSGQMSMWAGGRRDFRAESAIDLTNVLIHGTPLDGDGLSAKNIAADLSVSVVPKPARAAEVKFHIPLTARAADGAAGYVDISGDVSLDDAWQIRELPELAARSVGGENMAPAAISGSGWMKISSDLDLANVVQQLPHLTHLRSGVTVTGGRWIQDLTLKLTGNKLAIERHAHLRNLKALQDGHLIKRNHFEAANNQTRLRDIGTVVAAAMKE